MKRGRLTVFGLGVTILVLLNGCAANYQVITNTYLSKSTGSSSLPKQANFYVWPNTNIPNQLFDQEVQSKIEALLTKQGYAITDKDRANYWVRFSYDIMGRAITTNQPEWVTGPTVVQRIYVSGQNNYQSIVTPGYSYVTYASETHNVYNARLFIRVVDPKHQNQGPEESVIWVGDTMNESQNPDLRESIDYLLVTTFKFFGRDTSKNQTLTLAENDPEVLDLRARIKPLQVVNKPS